MKFEANTRDLIYDYFVYEDKLIAVLNNKDSLDDDHKNLLLLAEIKQFEYGNLLIELNEEEYAEIMEYYIELKHAYLKEKK